MRNFTPAMLLLLALSATQAKAQDKCELYSDNVTVNPGDQYHLLFKSYSQTIKDYLKNHPRITIDFTTTTPDIVTVGGAWFQSKKTGTAQMKAIIYKESKIKDYPDWNGKLDSVEFTVQVPADKFTAALPEVPTNWGAAKQTVIDATKAKYTLFSDTFYEMHPSVTEKERSYFDWFSTGDYEYPLIALGYSEEGTLFSSNIMVNDGARLGYNKESEISGYLEKQGFQMLGWDDMGLLIMYRDADKTQASASIVTIQGQYFRDLNFQYTPEKPTDGISATRLTRPDASFVRNGEVLTIEAGNDKGQPVAVYSLSGSTLSRSVLHAGSNTLQLGSNKPVIVRVGKHQGVKVF